MVRPPAGASPSGKAVDFDSTIPRFESWRPSQHTHFFSECRWPETPDISANPSDVLARHPQDDTCAQILASRILVRKRRKSSSDATHIVRFPGGGTWPRCVTRPGSSVRIRIWPMRLFPPHRCSISLPAERYARPLSLHCRHSRRRIHFRRQARRPGERPGRGGASRLRGGCDELPDGRRGALSGGCPGCEGCDPLPARPSPKVRSRSRARFAAWGNSAGGYLAVMAGVTGTGSAFDDPALGNATQPSHVQAVIDWFGPVDFRSQDAELRASGKGRPVHHLPDSPESRFWASHCRTRAKTCCDAPIHSHIWGRACRHF